MKRLFRAARNLAKYASLASGSGSGSRSELSSYVSQFSEPDTVFVFVLVVPLDVTEICRLSGRVDMDEADDAA